MGLEKAFKQLGVKHAEAHKTAAMYVVDLHGGEPDRDNGVPTFLYLAIAMALNFSGPVSMFREQS